MSCTDFDLRDYFLGELAEPDRLAAHRHLSSCASCAASLESWRHLRLSLEAVPDEEPPQRIGFVSDKIFEPSPARRLWNRFWHSGPQLGFASAALLSLSLLAVAFRPATVIVQYSLPVPVADSAPQVHAAVAKEVEHAVDKAVAETEARQEKRTALLLAAQERRHNEAQRALMLTVADSFTMLQKRAMVNRASLVSYGGEGQ